MEVQLEVDRPWPNALRDKSEYVKITFRVRTMLNFGNLSKDYRKRWLSLYYIVRLLFTDYISIQWISDSAIPVVLEIFVCEQVVLWYFSLYSHSFLLEVRMKVVFLYIYS